MSLFFTKKAREKFEERRIFSWCALKGPGKKTTFVTTGLAGNVCSVI